LPEKADPRGVLAQPVIMGQRVQPEVPVQRVMRALSGPPVQPELQDLLVLQEKTVPREVLVHQAQQDLMAQQDQPVTQDLLDLRVQPEVPEHKALLEPLVLVELLEK
jgi:hypothetical protein